MGDLTREPTPEERAALKLVREIIEAHTDDDYDSEHEAGEVCRVLFHFDPVIRAAVEAETSRCSEVEPMSVKCEICGSPPDRTCYEPNGYLMPFPHDERWRAAIRATAPTSPSTDAL